MSAVAAMVRMSVIVMVLVEWRDVNVSAALGARGHRAVVLTPRHSRLLVVDVDAHVHDEEREGGMICE